MIESTQAQSLIGRKFVGVKDGAGTYYRQRVLTVERVDKPHPIYPGRLRPGLDYAFCKSTVAGRPSRKVVIAVGRLLSPDYVELKPQPQGQPQTTESAQ